MKKPPLSRTLYLHVGTDKTGTSALQVFFSKNVAKLQEAGIYYPETGREGLRQHHWLIAPISGFATTAGFPPRQDWEAVQGALWKEVEGRDEPHVLISSELLSQGIDFDRLASLRDHFDGVRIICYLRRQDEYAMSAYEQRVKTLGLSEPFTPDLIPIPDYYALLKQLEEFAGNAQFLIVRPYERRQFRNDSIYADFMYHVFGFALDEGYAYPDPNETNPRVTRDGLEFLRLANGYAPLSRRASLLGPLLAYSHREKPESELPFMTRDIIAPRQRGEILARGEAINGAIAREYLGRADGILFRNPPPDPDEPWEPYPGLQPNTALDIAQFVFGAKMDEPDLTPENKILDLALVTSVLEEVFEGLRRAPGAPGLDERNASEIYVRYLRLYNSIKIAEISLKFGQYRGDQRPYEQEAPNYIHDMLSKIGDLQENLHVLDRKIQEYRQDLSVAAELKEEISALRKSTSWRLTAPLRAISAWFTRNRNLRG